MIILKLSAAIIAFVIILIVVIGLHELGHFIAARLLGIKVIRFCLGLGKPIYRYIDRHGIEYAFAPIPLGGYVKLLDEREGPVNEQERHLAFNRQALWKRSFVILLGPLVNLFLAIFAFYLAFVMGVVRPLPIIAEIVPHSLAANAGMMPKQMIIEVDNLPVADSWHAAVYIVGRLGEAGNLNLKVRDNEQKKDINYYISLSEWHPDPLKSDDALTSLGIKLIKPPFHSNQFYYANYSLLNAWKPAISEISLLIWIQGKMIMKLLSGKISVKNFSGPISLFRGAAIAFSQGIVSYLLFIAFLSTAVFMINCLPIPGLDGGHLLYFGIEKISGKPVSTAVQVLAFRLSFILLCVLSVQLLLYDVIRLFS